VFAVRPQFVGNATELLDLPECVVQRVNIRLLAA
jgi:hypothetical protein